MPTLNHKSSHRAKILAYLARNGLSPLADIMTGIGETVRAKAQSNINAAAQDGLIARKRDDVTNLPGYEITEAGRIWLKANGRAPNPKPSAKPAPAAKAALKATACDTPTACTESQTPAAHGDSEGGETDAQREAFSLLGVIADIRKAIGDSGTIMLGNLAHIIEQLIDAHSSTARQQHEAATQLEAERDDLRARLDAVTQQSVNDIDLLTEKNDKLHSEIDHLRADLNNAQRKLDTARAENLALKTLEESMPGFGAEHQAQRIQTLEEKLAEARAEARTLEDRIDALITKELVTSEPTKPSGFILRADKRPDLSRSTFKQKRNAISAGTTAVRKGAKRVRIYALVPAGQVVPGAEFKN